ncbi:hypothetical protein BD413DRAFT_565590 [Trametes elegans]|nr:hypothetical protein BD413DRAFT_565590 [Trametes elegans]
MEVLSRPRAVPKPIDQLDQDPAPSPTLLVAPLPLSPSPPRLPSADHRLSIPTRPSVSSLPSRRHSATVGPMSPSHLSRPLRSSPLAGPSIAVSSDGTYNGAASAPATPVGGSKHLSPLAEFSTTAPTNAPPATDADTKKHRRRTLGVVLSKLSFPAPPAETASEPTSPASPEKLRRRTKSTTSEEAPPPVPPVPAWAHHTVPTGRHSPRYSHMMPSPPRAHTSPACPTPRPASPTPSTRSATSSMKHDSRRTSFLPPSSSTPSAEANWLTQSAAPRFSRIGLKAEGVILPVSAREARRRSTASVASMGRAKSYDALPPPPVRARTPSRASTAPIDSFVAIAGPSTATPTTANQARFRSRASSRASLASAASGLSLDCDTPSLTMSPGPSASDVSLGTQTAEADELGVLTSHVEFQLNDVPVGVLALPAQAYAGKGKARADGPLVLEHGTPWVHPHTRSTPSLARSSSGLSSAATSVVDLSGPGPALHKRAATAPDMAHSTKKEGAKTKRSNTLGRVWKTVVRSVTTRR